MTERFDGPYRYRCQAACQQLRDDGAVANVLHVRDRTLPGILPRYGVVVLFRLPWSDRVEAIVSEARRAGVPILFDIDDLVFDPSFAALMPFRARYSREEWTRTYGNQMVGLRRTFDASDAFIGSTPELAEHAERFGKRAFVHPNVVPSHYLALGRWLDRAGSALEHPPTIGYFSGSDTHDEDFASVTGALDRVLRDHRSARVLVVGHLDRAGRSGRVRGRLVRLPYMHWKDFASAYAMCQVTIAPLSVDNAFTRGKSALKFFEAAAFGTPVVATPVREMSAAIRHGVTGFLATTPDEWAESLDRALEPGARARIGAAARRSVEEGLSPAAVRGRLFAILARFAVPAAGREPRESRLEVPDETGTRRALRRAERPVAALRSALSIARSVRAPLPSEPDPAEVEALLAPPSGEHARPPPGNAVVFSAEELEAFEPNEQVTAEGDLPGERRSIGSDPQLVGTGLDLDLGKFRRVAIRLRAFSNAPAVRVQIFWKSDEREEFSERRSVAFSASADGVEGTYVAELGADARPRQPVRYLRIDPMNRPGTFRIGALAFFREEGGGHGPRAAEPEPPATLHVPSTNGREALEAAVSRLEPGRQLVATLDAVPARARETLGTWLAGTDVSVDEVRQPDAVATSFHLTRKKRAGRRGIDVVVPVYNARELVRRCLSSVLEHARGDYRLVIVDDASTDPELVPMLRSLASRHDHVVLLENPENLGFVHTANRGMQQASGRDVLLLNSDAEVFEGFLERLGDAAYSHPRAGLVSPLSNNATICSVPEFCVENALPEGTPAAEVARIVALSSRRRRPELVTPHGFCLYLRADCLREVGFFDTDLFGRGFGEENDLGERAREAGFRTLLADDVYVWHQGKASFGDEGRALERRHAEVLEKRHPGYHARVAGFVRDNPLAAIQGTLRRHLARGSQKLLPAPLLVLHANPFADERGGVEHCVRDLVRELDLPRTVLLYPTAEGLEAAELLAGRDSPDLYGFPLDAPPGRFCHDHPEALRAIGEVLDLFRIGWVHVHHLMFLPLAIVHLLEERGLPYLATVHDFYPVCPSFNLLDVRTTEACCPASCGDRARTTACQKALFAKLGETLPPDPVAFVNEHRRLSQDLFDGARAVIFPSASARRIAGEMLHLDEAQARVLPHGWRAPPRPRPGPEHRDRFRVALVGQVAYASKGADAYLAVMDLCGGEVEWHVFGRADLFGFDQRIAAMTPRPTVVFHGGYDRDTIVPRLGQAGIDLALLLPAWPETFSYTLGEIAAAGVPLVARRIGALAERLEGQAWGVLVDGPSDAAREVLALSRDRSRLSRMRSAVPALPDPGEWARAHRDLYAECADCSPVTGPRPATDAELARLEELCIAGAPARPSGVSVTRPAEEVTRASWYPLAERLKPYAPESVRQIVRRRLSRDGSKTVVRFRVPGRFAKLAQELTLERRYLATARLVSHGTDPNILLRVAPFDPHSIKLVRFNLWCSTPKAVFAQLYFRHDGTLRFDEEHSLTIPLDGGLGAWQEYTARIDTSPAARTWYEGGPIVALRFDPINVPGPFMLGELSLCDVLATPVTNQ